MLDSQPSSPTMPFRRKSWARRIERCCCTTLSYFPLTFVYGLTTWAVVVSVKIGSWQGSITMTSYLTSLLSIALYTLANVSYTTAVFTTPGSPLDPRQDWSDRSFFNQQSSSYSALPTHDTEPSLTTLTAKSTGKPRFCKKCTTAKPDRAHHCSSCGRCVLKMDHHCPWLATCVGLHNYKPFILFLIYTTLFCWTSFCIAGWWVWNSLGTAQQAQDGMKIVNAILLAVLGGIIGLVLSGFTGWHLYLVMTGQTTIESLEKTRYFSPVKQNMEQQFKQQAERHYLGQDPERHGGEGQEQSLLEHLKETHANALPGVLRPEEGEDCHSHTPQPPLSSSPAKASLQSSYASLEAQRERERYSAYLDEQDSHKLPNAFDLGWKRNMQHVFGHRPLLWWLPVCNSSGDGWAWEVSDKWREASAEVARERQARAREEAAWGAQPTFEPPKRMKWIGGHGFVDQVGGQIADFETEQNGEHDDVQRGEMQMQPLDRRKPGGPPRKQDNSAESSGDNYDTSSDEEPQRRPNGFGTSNWNDIPDDFLTPGQSSRQQRSRSRGRRKGD